MPVSVTMPQLGESVTEGTVTRWLKAEGDTVVADEPLLEVSTDKVDTEIPSPASGVLTRIVAAEDAVVLVGGELAIISDSADSPADTPAVERATPPAPSVVLVAELQAASEVPAPSQDRVEATQVVLPALGESVTEGTVTRWLKSVGDAVTADEPLLEVSTDKVDTEIPSPATGILLSIDVAEDETVPVGAVLAQIGSEGAPTSAAPTPAAAPVPAAAAAAPSPFRPAPSLVSPPATAPPVATPAPDPTPPLPPAEATETTVAASNDDSVDATYVTPLVRKLAAEHSVDLATVTGSGVGGRIRKQDVLEAAARARTAAVGAAAPATAGGTHAAPAAPAPTASPLRGRTEPMSRLRKVIAERMVESLQVSAQLTSVVEVDVSRIASLRQRAKGDFEAREGVKLSFLPFFAKASVEALKVFPNLNASIDQEAGTITYHAAEHLGVAVDTERGLLVPVIRDAGDLNIGGLARKITDLAHRTRTNKITPDELSGGTFTLTNTGSRGALFDTPIINMPQVAILGTGAVVRRPVVVSDENGGDVIAIRSMVYLALTYDHRLVDGADAARFLTALKVRLEEGSFESDLGL